MLPGFYEWATWGIPFMNKLSFNYYLIYPLLDCRKYYGVELQCSHRPSYQDTFSRIYINISTVTGRYKSVGKTMRETLLMRSDSDRLTCEVWFWEFARPSLVVSCICYHWRQSYQSLYFPVLLTVPAPSQVYLQLQIHNNLMLQINNAYKYNTMQKYRTT